MQMPALLLAILLAGGNPVWDRDSAAGQTQACSEQVAAQTESAAQKSGRVRACAAETKPVAEAPAPVVRTR